MKLALSKVQMCAGGAHQRSLSDLHLPTVLDMTAVTSQTRRMPKGGKEYENCDVHGSATVYMDDYFVLEPFSGVLKVTAKIVARPWCSFFTLDKVRTSLERMTHVLLHVH